ncbi:TOBE domain-containing protein, partial [Gordonia sp. (in: high G+C Gram-positive bacteria)]|uniref:TOBE domain-containing protein n=1 Tax=Gordonia sp. (in: high G+C Gram-positive bacteria) TaxID=84139 RepID=UPI0016B364CF
GPTATATGTTEENTANETDGTVTVPGVVAETVYAGAHTRYLVDTEGQGGEPGVRFIVEKQNTHTPRTEPSVSRGDRVAVQFQRDHAMPIVASEAPRAVSEANDEVDPDLDANPMNVPIP